MKSSTYGHDHNHPLKILGLGEKLSFPIPMGVSYH